jgi:NADH-quinone oxidoreductase subunit A
MFSGFGPILLFLAISIGISFAVVSIPFFVSRFVTKTYKPDPEKNSIYECGFNPIEQFSVSPSKFNVKYFLVAILFIIFDIEIAFLFPWALNFKTIGWVGFSSMMIFLFILTVGFVYEFSKGALDW